MHYFGYFGRRDQVARFTEEAFIAAVREAMEKLEREGAVIHRGEICSLTPEGQLRVEKMQREFRAFRGWMERFLHLQMVAPVGLGWTSRWWTRLRHSSGGDWSQAGTYCR